MKRRGLSRLASGLGLCAALLLATSIVLLYVNDFVTLMTFNHPDGGYDSGFVAALAATFPEAGASNTYLLAVNLALAMTFTPMGVLLASRQPDNSLGWLFCAAGIIVGVLGVADQYTVYTVVTEPGSLPGAQWSAWLASWVWLPVQNLMFALLPLLFPDGRPPTRNWRPVVWLVALGMALITVYLMFLPGSITGNEFPIENPLGISGANGLLEICLGAGALIGWFSVLAAAVSVLLRLLRSQGRERQQIKWLAYAAAVASLSLLAGTLVRGLFGLDVTGTILEFAALPLLPVAIAAAVLRYRLYDIDFIINKTIVYTALTLSLLAVYFVFVSALEYLLRTFAGSESQIGIVVSTLVIAALFNPFRRIIQGFIDRRFYRQRYDARETLDDFADRLRDEVELDHLTEDLVGVVKKSLKPEHVSLLLIPAANENSAGEKERRISENSSRKDAP